MKSICAAIAMCCVCATVQGQQYNVVAPFTGGANEVRQVSINATSWSAATVWVSGGSPFPNVKVQGVSYPVNSSIYHDPPGTGIRFYFVTALAGGPTVGSITVASLATVPPGPYTYGSALVQFAGGSYQSPGASSELVDPDTFEHGESFDDAIMPEFDSDIGTRGDDLLPKKFSEGTPLGSGTMSHNPVFTVPGQSPITMRLHPTYSGPSMLSGLPTFGRPSNAGAMANDFSFWRTWARTSALGLVYLGAFRRCVNVLLVS
jgi:hypothetical protein